MTRDLKDFSPRLSCSVVSAVKKDISGRNMGQKLLPYQSQEAEWKEQEGPKAV